MAGLDLQVHQASGPPGDQNKLGVTALPDGEQPLKTHRLMMSVGTALGEFMSDIAHFR
eukprot:CAMPEP_0203918342 /NCGR_PEP_ID=MMETSP0359-20131031/58867_1 /ASSEMBLY_ACC=CAM_ASM_000338 /TAXON_ID=268821 /ORGANISM="Scrippsiella Hangoei, Strain SHTV-5" /LENGTH=57 /DNA_ID=CAMNT_0050845411 /DNA_START=141 /DNA_END=312 /DNA_ORIENTATION=+